MIPDNQAKFQFKNDVAALKQIRDSLGLSQEQFARALGVATTVIARCEQGRSQLRLTIEKAKKLDELIEPLGLRIKDLPDYLGKPIVNERN